MLGNGVKHIGSRAHCASGSGNQPQKSLTHLFSFRDQRLWGDFRLIWILGLVTEKGNDTRNKFVPYGPELHEYMMWFKFAMSKGEFRELVVGWWIYEQKS